MLQLNYKKIEILAPFPPLIYTANATMNCAISPKPIRAAEELAKGAAETFLNGCEGDSKNGGEGLQSTHGAAEESDSDSCKKFVL